MLYAYIRNFVREMQDAGLGPTFLGGGLGAVRLSVPAEPERDHSLSKRYVRI